MLLQPSAVLLVIYSLSTYAVSTRGGVYSARSADLHVAEYRGGSQGKEEMQRSVEKVSSMYYKKLFYTLDRY